MNNTTDEEGEGEEKSVETFHIYILSFSYGFLLLIVLGHLVVRWRWRRFLASKFASHFPGDKSFKCKAIRQRLCSDFEAISKLSPDPTLINLNYDPEVFGPCEGGATVPSHWYRMKTCEAATEFVTTNENLLRSVTSYGEIPVSSLVNPSQRVGNVPTLPGFVSRLRSSGLLYTESEEKEELIRRSCDLYTTARFKDGEFPESLFREFIQCLRKLQDMLQPILLNSGTRMSPSPSYLQGDPGVSTPSGDPMVLKRLSIEPLLATSMNEPAYQAPPSEKMPTRMRMQSRTRRTNTAPELSPLIQVEPPSFLESSFTIPETPL